MGAIGGKDGYIVAYPITVDPIVAPIELAPLMTPDEAVAST